MLGGGRSIQLRFGDKYGWQALRKAHTVINFTVFKHKCQFDSRGNVRQKMIENFVKRKTLRVAGEHAMIQLCKMGE